MKVRWPAFVRAALFAVAAATALAGPVRAQTATDVRELALAEEMAQLLGLRSAAMLTEQIVETLWVILENGVPVAAPDAVRTEIRAAIADAMQEQIGDGLMAAADGAARVVAPSIAGILTGEEMEAWLAFYETPAGTRLLEAAPLLVAYSTGVLSREVQTVVLGALGQLNPLLISYGFRPLPIPDTGAPLPPRPVLTPLQDTALTLLTFPPEYLEELATLMSDTFADDVWAAFIANVPTEPQMRTGLRIMFDAAIAEYYRERALAIPDEMAVELTRIMSAEEIAAAAAFYRSPVAQNWLASLPLVESSLLTRISANSAVTYSLGVAAGNAARAEVDAILLRAGLPPLAL